MLADTEEVALSFEQSNIGTGNLLQTNRIRHPIALCFHLLFRTTAIFLYIFSSFIFGNFITVFVIMIALLSADFWTVKNISGRLLVGLRWWNHVDEDGKSHWVFENRKNNQSSNNLSNPANIESTIEVSLFWSSIVVANAIWVVFFVVALLTFSFKWMTIIIIALMFNLSNTYGFLKCRFGSDSNLSTVASGFFGKQMLQTMMAKATGNGTQAQTSQAQNEPQLPLN